jgi:hypothetical protein
LFQALDLIVPREERPKTEERQGAYVRRKDTIRHVIGDPPATKAAESLGHVYLRVRVTTFWSVVSQPAAVVVSNTA